MTKTCCEEPKNHKYRCGHCKLESNNQKVLYKHQKEKHANKAIHFVIIKWKTLTQESKP